ncbi:MAG TPA: hypothetical protein VLA29_06165 [Acidimicrobiia bacterium]|nr:hypothetical protein [Acidimicrobiia bacterium]
MRGLRARIILLALMTMVISLVPGIASAATMTATIDFDDLAHGTVVTSLSNGSGISGDNIGGSVGVTATGGSNKAVIFDAAGANCSSGPDPDLCSATSDIGKMLIVSENGGPNDWVGGGMLTLTLPGTFTVKSVFVKDFGDSHGDPKGAINVGGGSAFFVAGSDGNEQIVNVGLAGNTIVIRSNDSFAVDNIVLEWTTPDNPGTGTIGYWKNHPDAWPPSGVTIGGVAYSVEAAIAIMNTPGRGDKTYDMFNQLVAAVLNVEIGNDASCISSTITAAQAWLTANPLGSNVRANSSAWQGSGSSMHSMLDAYNNGLLCAPSRDA